MTLCHSVRNSRNNWWRCGVFFTKYPIRVLRRRKPSANEAVKIWRVQQDQGEDEGKDKQCATIDDKKIRE